MRIDYDTHVFCSTCEEPRLRLITQLIPNWGYKCPECGKKCRVKPKYTSTNYYKTHPFESSGRVGRSAIRQEILRLAKAEARLV